MVYEPYQRSLKRHLILDRYDRWRATARILGLSKEARQRLEWIVFYHERAGQNGALVCRHFGLHRNTFGKWLKAFDEANLRSLETRSRKPHRLRQRAAQAVKDDRGSLPCGQPTSSGAR